jgi:hypothetical protein
VSSRAGERAAAGPARSQQLGSTQMHRQPCLGPSSPAWAPLAHGTKQQPVTAAELLTRGRAERRVRGRAEHPAGVAVAGVVGPRALPRGVDHAHADGVLEALWRPGGVGCSGRGGPSNGVGPSQGGVALGLERCEALPRQAATAALKRPERMRACRGRVALPSGTARRGSGWPTGRRGRCTGDTSPPQAQSRPARWSIGSRRACCRERQGATRGSGGDAAGVARAEVGARGRRGDETAAAAAAGPRGGAPRGGAAGPCDCAPHKRAISAGLVDRRARARDGRHGSRAIRGASSESGVDAQRGTAASGCGDRTGPENSPR